MDVARHWLGPRLPERPVGYWLDGGLVNQTRIMREVNRMLVNMGAEQINATPLEAAGKVPHD